jgi:hypothetical protein
MKIILLIIKFSGEKKLIVRPIKPININPKRPFSSKFLLS